MKNKVYPPNADVGRVQGSMADPRTGMEMNNERQRRLDDIIIHNLREHVTNSKSTDKELVSKLVKKSRINKTGQRLFVKEITEIFRIGTKDENASRPRPVKMKFDNQRTKIFR